MKTEPADLVFSFDCTGSMSACLGAVRREVEKTVTDLFAELPDLRVGIIVHNDYCDDENCLQKLDLTTNQKAIVNFIRNAIADGGGDEDECYEYVLNETRKMSWGNNRSKALVLIGDASPHPVGYTYYEGNIYLGKKKVNTISWQEEAKSLVKEGVTIYPVQALGRKNNEKFYQTLADISNTPKLDLAQFGQVTQLLQAICYKQSNRLPEFESLLRAKATERIDFSLLNNLDKLSGKKVSAGKSKVRADGLVPVHPSRFQILSVSYNCSIKEFVENNGLKFKKGKGFYLFNKKETVQESKEVIVQDKLTGEMFSGEAARNLIGLPYGKRGDVLPSLLEKKYKIFIQSTSSNRCLNSGTDFLYEVEDFHA